MTPSIRLEPAVRDGITLHAIISAPIAVEALAPDAPVITLHPGPRGIDGRDGDGPITADAVGDGLSIIGDMISVDIQSLNFAD